MGEDCRGTRQRVISPLKPRVNIFTLAVVVTIIVIARNAVTWQSQPLYITISRRDVLVCLNKRDNLFKFIGDIFKVIISIGRKRDAYGAVNLGGRLPHCFKGAVAAFF